MQTGENEQALRKILDMTRLISIVLLFIHCYYYLYAAFRLWQLTTPFTDRILSNIAGTGLFANFHRSKLFALGFLVISLLGAKGKKEEKLILKVPAAYLLTGLLLYFISGLVLLPQMDRSAQAIIYIVILSVGFLLVLTGGTLLTRLIKSNIAGDIFNRDQESFPQEERLLENEYSFNLEGRYHWQGKIRRAWLNIVAPFRSTLVSGGPGSGKTAYVLRPLLEQAFAKENPYTVMLYDFKFPDLSVVAYNHWLKNKGRYKGEPKFIVINFEDLSRSHRGNVFDPMGMTDITDAAESARTILLGLNRDWQKKSGDFFVESAVNFVTAVIWYLRKYQNGEFCTLPHVIEFIQQEYDQLFTLLQTEKEIEVYVNPFIQAYKAGVMPQLEGQIGSAKIALARLASPQLYYVLSGRDFSLDINNPKQPKVICLGSNPQKTMTYGAVLSLYINRILKIINQKGKAPCLVHVDEFPTIVVDVIPTIATGRSNKISVCLGIQDLSQLKKDYGREHAEVIVNTVGTLISGQAKGESAKQLSEQIGKIMQNRQSLSINSSDTSISKSKQLEYAVPASKIATLSSGEFVAVVADSPDQKIELKAFYGSLLQDFEELNKEEADYQPLPVIRKVDPFMVDKNYMQIKNEVREIVNAEMERLASDPALKHLIIKKKT